MKKVVSLLAVLVLVLMMVPAVFAAPTGTGTSEDPYVIAVGSTEDIVVPAEGNASVVVGGPMTVTVTGPAANSADWNVVAGKTPSTPGTDGICVVPIPSTVPKGSTIVINNTSSAPLTLSVKVEVPLGSSNNPDGLVFDTPVDVEVDGENAYWYAWTAPCSGTLTVSASESEDDGYFTIMVNGNSDGAKDTYSVNVKKGDAVKVLVESYNYVAGTISFSVTFDHTHTLTHHDAVAAGEHTTGMAEHWYCSDCEMYFTDAEGVNNIAYLSLTTVAEHNDYIEHYEKAPACHLNGMEEYWYCSKCDDYYADAACMYPVASKSLTIPATTELVHVDAVPAGEHTNGMAEYWYCPDCKMYFTDAEGQNNIAYLSLTVLSEHSDYMEYHEELPATCHENGMKAYWYCSKCDTYYAADDTEFKYPVASKNLLIRTEGVLEHHEEVPATATENGMKEYWYCPECDCYFTDAEGKYNIAAKSLVIPALGEDGNPETGDLFSIATVAEVIVSSMSVVALVVSKKKFF
ncbi:MAG: hypothetical protein ACI4PO_05480 [Faecousia sp.]